MNWLYDFSRNNSKNIFKTDFPGPCFILKWKTGLKVESRQISRSTVLTISRTTVQIHLNYRPSSKLLEVQNIYLS